MKHLYLCATGKSGLGHIRRLSNLAIQLKNQSPITHLHLLTNAPIAGLTEYEITLFSSTTVLPREAMGVYLRSISPSVVIVDTAIIPQLERVNAPLALILRQTVTEKLSMFALTGTRPWDLLIVPNPEIEWQPDRRLVPARHIEYVGWIYRSISATDDDAAAKLTDRPSILVSCAGGGKNTSESVLPRINNVLLKLKNNSRVDFLIKQVISPRAPASRLAVADSSLQSCPTLHQEFLSADLVVTTAGYNSTLELAGTSVPVLFVPVDRNFDDQYARARRWSPFMGKMLGAGSSDKLVQWLIKILLNRQHRSPIFLGPSGAAESARLLLGFES